MSWKTETCKSCEYRRACEDATRIAELEEKVAQLQAIVNKLPKTADGVRVVPGVDRVWWPKAERGSDHWISGAIVGCAGLIAVWTYDIDKNPKSTTKRQITVMECFSTPEAAEAARAEGGA